MPTTDTIENTGTSEKRDGLLYPLLLIAAIAVIVFSVVGVTTMTGVMNNGIVAAG